MKGSLEWSRFQSRRRDHVLDVLRAARKRVWEGHRKQLPRGCDSAALPTGTQIQLGILDQKLWQNYLGGAATTFGPRLCTLNVFAAFGSPDAVATWHIGPYYAQ